jgi:hypothetical protein
VAVSHGEGLLAADMATPLAEIAQLLSTRPKPGAPVVPMKTKMWIARWAVEAWAMSRSAGLVVLALGVGLCSCASVTTKITGSARAGAEQLLLTGTSDRAVGLIDFRPLAGRRVFLDTTQVRRPTPAG